MGKRWPAWAAPTDASVVLRRFEKRLLAELGYAPILDRDAASRPIDPDRLYAYEPERGPTVVNGTRGDLPVVRGRTLLDVAADDYTSPKTPRGGKEPHARADRRAPARSGAAYSHAS